MTNELRIQVPIHCDRTGQDFVASLSKNAAMKHCVDQKLKHLNALKLTDIITEMPGPLPDLVVIYRGNLVVLETVVAKNEKGILRLLADLTRSPLFPKALRRARKTNRETG